MYQLLRLLKVCVCVYGSSDTNIKGCLAMIIKEAQLIGKTAREFCCVGKWAAVAWVDHDGAQHLFYAHLDEDILDGVNAETRSSNHLEVT